MHFWFPVLEEMLFHEDFIKSKPSDKLYYFTLLHELNLHKINYVNPFFKSDGYFAVALSYSEDTIRNARKYFQQLNWIQTKSGYKTKSGRNVATTYHTVNWTDIPKLKEGKRFIRFPHYDFAMMLEQLYDKKISHQDMVVYCYLICRSQLNWELTRSFKVTKKELREDTNIIKAIDCVDNISKVPVFGEIPVLEYTDYYHSLTIKFQIALDPYEDENNRDMFNNYMKRREERTKKLSANKKEQAIQKAKEKGLIHDQAQLEDLFKELYQKEYNRVILFDYFDSLHNLVIEHGVGNIESAIRLYFETPDSEIPNPTRVKTKTIGRFIKNVDVFLTRLSGND